MDDSAEACSPARGAACDHILLAPPGPRLAAGGQGNAGLRRSALAAEESARESALESRRGKGECGKDSLTEGS